MNTPIYNLRPQRSSMIPNIIFILLVLNGLFFAAQQFPQFANFLYRYFVLWPLGSMRADFFPWQLITYGFLHADIMHLMFNMFMLWMFGRELEMIMGEKRFLLYFLTGVVGAGIVQLLTGLLQGGDYPTVGASGGVFALLLAFGMAFPNRVIMLIIPPIPIQAKYMVVLAGVMEFFFGVSGVAPGVAHFAHLGGMLFGFLLLQYWSKPRRRG